jgi:hypothetical protein
MHYVFMETGDNTFFSKITSAFCLNVVQSILELHEHGVFNQPDGSIMLDDNNMTEFLKKDGRLLHFLNCHLFPFVTSDCENDGCKEDRIVVLTNEQVASISQSMKKAISAYLRAKDYAKKSDRERTNVQTVLQHYTAIIISQIIVLYLGDRSVRKNYSDYLNAYIRRSRTLLNKSDANGFVYIRSAGKKSDFDYFKDNTELPDVMPCDHYQRMK